MKSSVGVLLALVFGVAVAVGVAHSSSYAAETAELDDVATATLAAPLLDETALKPRKDGTGRGTCDGGTAPRCFRDECPSEAQCPAKDQCYGKLTCARYETVVGDGKIACRMLGDCRPPSTNEWIIIQ